jgi:predicted Rossmann-fold nucleotide-binding protein
MRRPCVFCRSSKDNDPTYLHAAQALGETQAVSGIGLVYGGASVGLMGLAFILSKGEEL